MKILMDIFTNWRKGKKEHNERVLEEINEKLTSTEMVREMSWGIEVWIEKREVEVAAKHWQILAEYAQDQVKALTTIKSDIVPTEATNDNSTFNPLKDRISTTIDGSTLNTVIQRAEKRHGYGIEAK